MRAAACLLLAFAVTGCASLITGGPLIREGEPTGYLQIANGSNVALDVVLLAPCSASSYGLNRLPRGMNIPQGRSYTFEVSAGCWAVAAGAVGSGDGKKDMTVAPGRTTRYVITGG